MRKWAAAGLLISSSCVHNTRDARREATQMFVSGKAYLCGEEHAVGIVAAGKTIRLISSNRVLAQDVVGPDGSYVLHPRDPQTITEPIYLEAGDHRVTLANDYASWMQDRLTYHGDIRFGCGQAPDLAAAAPETAAPLPEASTADGRVPPPTLMPKR